MTNDLEIRHCRVLVAVSEYGGVSSSARALGLAQSTVSETLLSLERLTGSPMTQRRRGQEAALTATALALLPHARALIAASEEALAAVNANSRTVIRLGAVESASTFLLPDALMEFRSRWPLVEVQITIGVCDDLRRRVHCGELDAAVTVESSAGALMQERSGSRVLSPAQLCLFVSPAEAPADHKMKQSELSRRTLLFADAGGAFNALMRTWFAPPGDLPRFESAGSIDGVKIGVRSRPFVGVLPGYAVARELATGEFHRISVDEPLPAIALGLTMQHGRKTVPAPLREMIESIERAL